MLYVSLTQRRLSIANAVALANGLPVIETKTETQAEWTPDDNESKCPGCNNIMRRYHPIFGLRSSYECDEWEFYCSPACVDGHSNAGKITDFLERMGWTLYWDNPNGDMVWAYIPDNDPDNGMTVKAVEGSEQWHIDKTTADRLAAEVERLLGNEWQPPKLRHAPIRRPQPTNV